MTPERREAIRWGVCGTIVVCAHLAAAGAMFTFVEPESLAEPAAAMVIELAAITESAPEPPSEVAPGPQEEQNDVPPEPVTETAETPPEPDPPPDPPPPEDIPPPPPEPQIQKAEVILPKPAEPKKPKPKPKPRVEATRAPKPVEARVARASVAPSEGQPSNNPYATSSWRSRVVAHLERNKRYPPEASARREQGVTRIAFSISRSGQVMSAHLAGSSGSSTLDGETLAMIRRASPLPAPPPEVPGGVIELSVPIRYNLR